MPIVQQRAACATYGSAASAAVVSAWRTTMAASTSWRTVAKLGTSELVEDDLTRLELGE